MGYGLEASKTAVLLAQEFRSNRLLPFSRMKERSGSEAAHRDDVSIPDSATALAQHRSLRLKGSAT